MTESIADLVLRLADEDDKLSDQAKYLILTALEGDEALASLLDGPGGPPAAPHTPGGDVTPPRPLGAHLSAIEVCGFRGIGEKATLELHPGPGLTIVAGRNGSGKSSFAEALELALTDNSYRWANRQPQWASSWRNLHQSQPCSIRVELTEDETGNRTVGVNWADGAEFNERTTWTQRTGKKQEKGIAALGWERAMELYRPILSYEELGNMLHARPSELYESLERLLGLEQINNAAKRLSSRLKQLEAPETEAKAAKAGLRKQLAAVQDDRATRAAELLRKHRPDLDALAAVAAGADRVRDDSSGLRALSEVTLPEQAEVATVAGALRQACAVLAALGQQATRVAQRRATLLGEALAWHAEHGVGACPVCRLGTLDDAWRERAAAELAEEEAASASSRAAKVELDRCRRLAHELVGAVAAVPTPAAARDLKGFAEVERALHQWRLVPEEPGPLADHVSQLFIPVASAVTQLRAEAQAALREREDAWLPLATQLAAWLEQARVAGQHADAVKDLQDATKWVRANIDLLRNQRLAPLAQHARHIWSTLRQESNVDLGSIALQGQGTRRHLALRAEVDGADAGAMGVMSQGELHALALALFLPRAARRESPLRFVVLDDPVQAMDPSKVDGLVRVLSELAEHRQVVVFSHDDRLAEVVRRTAEDARIIEVTRETQSRVRLRRSLNPALRYVNDAHGLAFDPHVPASVVTRVLPGLCRFAVEAAARDCFYRQRLRRGATRAAVETAWNDARGTRQKVALAVYGDPKCDLAQWQAAARDRSQVLAICTNAVHIGLHGDARDAVQRLRNVVDDLLWSRG